MSPILSQKQRRNIIATEILTLTYEQIAKKCGVSKRTIIRDVKAWKDEGGFEDFILEEWLILHKTVKQTKPSEAYGRATDLLRRQLKEKVEVSGEQAVVHKVEVDLDFESLTDEQRATLEQARSILLGKRKRES